jgi:hypothetical protein
MKQDHPPVEKGIAEPHHPHHVHHVEKHHGGDGHKHHHHMYGEHAAGHKKHHEHVEAMCGGGMSKGK